MTNLDLDGFDTTALAFPRGRALAKHVARGLAATDLPAAKIAAQVGYRLDTCAQRLAEARHAPLARMLLERHYRDAHRHVGQNPNRGWVPETRYIRPAGPMVPRESIDDVVADLLELAGVGLSYIDAAERLGKRPDSLYRRLDRWGRTGEVREAFGGRIDYRRAA